MVKMGVHETGGRPTWAVGTMVGIYLIMGGWGLIGVASTAKAALSDAG